MLKKIALLLLVLSSAGIVFAASDLNKQHYKVRRAYYHSIKSCSPGTFTMPSIDFMGYDINFKMIVYGKHDGKCHIRELVGGSDMRCALPMDVAKRYADENIRSLDESMKNGVSYSAYVNEVINNSNYCRN